MRYISCLVLVTFIGLFWPASAGATQPNPPGWRAIPHFGVLLTVAEDPVPRLGEKFRVRVDATSQAPRDVTGEVRIAVPSGIEVVEGDVARQIHPNPTQTPTRIVPRDYEWDLWLRPTRAGKFTIRGHISIPGGAANSWDESECALDLEVRADSVIVPRFSRTLRHERIADGQRFRYGGKHMVLIDGPEPWLADAHGQQSDPEAIDRPEGMCVGCGLAEPKSLRYAVTVGTDGRVRWIEPRRPDAPSEDPRVLEAAENALKRWRFRPARIGERAIANWAEVDVVVQPGPR
jgi:hypothetical protein